MKQSNYLSIILLSSLTVISGCGNESSKSNEANITKPQQVQQAQQITPEKVISSDFAVKCTYENYGAFDYVIGVASEDSIYMRMVSQYDKKAFNPTKTAEAYQFTTNNEVRNTYWRLDRKTAVLTAKTQGLPFEETPKNCVTLSEDEHLRVLNEILNKLADDQKKIDDAREAKQQKINEYNNKKPQF